MAPVVAAIIASELQRDAAWEEQQVKEYTEMAKAYVLS
jgi:glycerol-3-phosphate dehydrogenase